MGNTSFTKNTLTFHTEECYTGKKQGIHSHIRHTSAFRNPIMISGGSNMKERHTRKKQLTALILAALLTGSAFVSCGGSETETMPAEQNTARTETPPTPETDYLETLPQTGYAGETFTIIGEDTAQRPNFDQGESTGDAFNDVLFHRRILVENLYDIVIEQKSMPDRGSSNNEVQRSVLADESVYDLVSNPFIQGSAVLMVNNLLRDMKTLPTVDFGNDWWAQNVVEHFMVNDRMYLTTGTLSPSYFLSATAVLYNTELAAQYQLGDLPALVQEGGWTLDAMQSMMQTSTHDLNGDGVIDEKNDLIGAITTSESGRALFVAAGGTLIEKQGNTYVLDMASARNVDIMDTLHGIFADALDSAYWVADSITSGKNDVFEQNHSMFTVTTLMFVSAELRDMEMDYGILPLPKWDTAQENYITPGNPFCPCAICVPKTCSNPELTGLVLETLAYLGHRDVQPVMYDTVLKGKVARDQSSAAIMEIIYADVSFDFNSAFDLSGTMTALRSYVVGSADNFISTYESKKTAARTELDKILGQMQELTE